MSECTAHTADDEGNYTGNRCTEPGAYLARPECIVCGAVGIPAWLCVEHAAWARQTLVWGSCHGPKTRRVASMTGSAA